MPFKIECKASAEDKHTYDVNSIIYHQDKIYTGADDGKIKLWDKTLRKLGEVQAHESSIYSLAASNDTVYSCSNDGSVKSWGLNLEGREVLFRREGSEFWKLAVSPDGSLFVGDDKGVVYMLVDGVVKANFEILEPVKDMFIYDKYIFSSKDIDVIITEIGEGPKFRFANRKNIAGRAPICLADDKLVITGSSAKDIWIHEANNSLDYKPVAQIQGAHDMIINSLVATKTNHTLTIYSGGWDKVVKEWQVFGGSYKLGEVCQLDLVISSMVLVDGVIYAAGGDGNIVKIQTN